MTALRWGLLGTARINRRLIPAMRAAGRSAVAAVASRDRARAAAYASEWDIPLAFGSYEALLGSDAVDAVYIPLPNSLHVEWTLAALAAGKHVLCEKPLALTPADVERIAAAAAAADRVAAEGFMYRHEPLTRHVAALVAGGAVGELVHVDAGFTYTQSRAGDVRLDPALGGGSLWDVGCYAVSYARLLAGEPVSAFGWARPGPSGTDDSFAGLLRTSAGVTASVVSSFRAGNHAWLEATGSTGTLRLANPFKPGPSEVIEIRRDEAVERLAVPGSPRMFVAEIEDFVGAALDGRLPAVTLADSRGNAAALAALSESARRGAPVPVYP
ncbi:MAG: Gfo/Idh/MocA family oxidoreductase [Acidobacteriota bacterium]